MKLIALSKPDQNRAAIDPWTAVHFSAGLAAGLIEMHRETALGAALAYEVVEQVFERSDAGREFFKTSGPEEPANVVVDIAVFAFGYWLGERWNRSG
ncbi:hypothetical protein [Gaopeijia maritima]|uniref:Uncharacterized protein n=1 Tax=Gaopeijia maritima TaxID=3119007 RepID=A0ABU9EDA7_9BACT